MKGPVEYQADIFTKRFRSVRRTNIEVSDIHIPLVSALRWAMKPEVIWRHVPNGEHREPRTAAKLKAMGVLAGSADLEFIWKNPNGELRMLFMELKAAKRKQSEAQELFAQRVHAVGAWYVVVRSMDEALDTLRAARLLRDDVRISPLSSD